MKRKLLTEIICCLLILLFLYTATSKWLDFHRFTGELNNQPLPNRFTPFLSWAIPITEITIVLFLLFPFTRQAGLWMSLVLMSLFTGYTGLVLLNVFERVPCSCGGVIRLLTWKQHLYFNLFFTGISLAGILTNRPRKYEKRTLNLLAS